FGRISALEDRSLGLSHRHSYIAARDAPDSGRLRDFADSSILDARQISDFHLCRRAYELVPVIRKVLHELQTVAENINRREILASDGFQIREQLQTAIPLILVGSVQAVKENDSWSSDCSLATTIRNSSGRQRRPIQLRF